MSNEQDSKGGEGRGLPRGWGWREDEDGFALRLYPPGCGSLDYSAAVYRDGSFIAYRGARGSEEIAYEDRDDPRTPETIAAAQAAAEAALWRRDGFGVGEVRGVPVTIDFKEAEHFVMFSAPVSLPGLPGLWRLTAAREHDGARVEVDAVKVPLYRCAGSACPGLPYRASEHAHPVACVGEEGGVEVDAVRAPSAVDKAARAWASISQIGDDGSHPADGASETAEADDHADGCAYYFADAGDADALCDCGKGEPAPSKEPSAPTDGGELARLLPGLADYCAVVLTESDEDTRSRHSVGKRLARACELLLAERERLTDAAQRSFTIGAGEIDKRRRAERECAALRARVAVLEAGRSRPEVQAIEAVFADEQTLRNWLRLNGHGDALDAGRSGVEVAIALLSAPPPGTSAALLARVEEARRGVATKASNTVGASGANFQDGKAAGLREAASLIRATLTPSLLDGVVAEVCALPVEMPTFYASVDSVEDGLHAVDMLIGDHELPRRDRLARIARVALAGMLACDAAKGGA